MFELIQQSRQMSNQNKLRKEWVSDLKEKQHSRFQVLADKIQARLKNANGDIDQDVFEDFCKRVLAVTFRHWMCKP